MAIGGNDIFFYINVWTDQYSIELSMTSELDLKGQSQSKIPLIPPNKAVQRTMQHHQMIYELQHTCIRFKL
jgi:hypothetical protein